jgi:hypothetical protein
MARSPVSRVLNRLRSAKAALLAGCLLFALGLLPGCSGDADKSEKKPAADGVKNPDGGLPQDLPFVQKPPQEAGPAVAKDASAGKENIAKPARKIVLEKLPPVTTNNRNTLVQRFRTQLRLTASSTWRGWPPENATDDNIKTSWFSGQDDSAAKGKRPWLQVNFPTDVPVERVTILGNRDPEWLIGFTILAGSVTLYDGDGRVLKQVQNNGTGNYRDFDFRFSPAVKGVRGVRFTSLLDQGNDTEFGDIAIAEIQVE